MQEKRPGFGMARLRCREILCIVLLFLGAGTASRAQSTGESTIDEIHQALKQGQYQFAAALADSAISHFDQYSPQALAEIHVLRALLASEAGQMAALDLHFMAALQLNPEQKLDPVFFSPSLQERFERLRGKLPAQEAPVRVEMRYVTLPDPRLTAAWKSLILPGWGQRYKGQRTKAVIFHAATGTLVVATAASHLLRQQAEKRYLRANETDARARYDTFNRYHLLRNNLALALSVAWAASVLDALIVKPASPVHAAVGMLPPSSPAGPALQFSLSLSL